MKIRFWLSLLLVIAVTGCGSSDDSSVNIGGGSADIPSEPARFTFVEGTIAQERAAIRDGTLTCKALVQGYLNRIDAYDAQGPELRSVINVNPRALDRATALDIAYERGGFTGPLHCVPVLLKDNFDTQDVATTAGGNALAFNQPPDNAFSVAGILKAGGLVLGKANLDEFAFGFQGSSSIRGQVKNAYDPTKGPGGSSSGTAAAIAASFAMAGTGSDTGGSVRVPSSLEGLVGIRPSLRLVSQDGIVPLASSQDTGGPICRTVEDCALMLDAMVGFDPSSTSNQRQEFAYDSPLLEDAEQYQTLVNVPDSYTEFLKTDGLDGAHIAALMPLFGDGTHDNAQVQSVLMAAIEQMRAAGATVDILSADDLAARDVVLSDLTDFASNSRFEFRADLTSYLMSWPSTMDGHLRSFDEVEDSMLYLERNIDTFDFYGTIGRALANPDEDSDEVIAFRETYQRNLEERPGIVRSGLLRILNNRDEDDTALGAPYDALLYPSVLSLAPPLGASPNAGSNNRLSPFSGFPALSMPAGMATNPDPSTDDEPALPVGMELLAREFDEPTLIRLAYGYEQVASPRETPTFTPELVSDDG